MAHSEAKDIGADTGAPLRVSAGAPPTWPQIASWSAADTFHWARPTEALRAFVTDALGSQNLIAQGEVVLLRHGPGDRGLPGAEVGASHGFTLDLTDARRTLDGGLLLFVEESGRVSGWRAERGALTLWSGADPDLTELAPGAPERLTLFGRAQRA